jgi:hypothetical protein
MALSPAEKQARYRQRQAVAGGVSVTPRVAELPARVEEVAVTGAPALPPHPTLAEVVALVARHRVEAGRPIGAEWGAYLAIARAWAPRDATPEEAERIWDAVMRGRASVCPQDVAALAVLHAHTRWQRGIPGADEPGE